MPVCSGLAMTCLHFPQLLKENQRESTTGHNLSPRRRPSWRAFRSLCGHLVAKLNYTFEEMSAALFQMCAQVAVNDSEVGLRHKTEGDTALVGDNDDFASGMVKASDSGFDAGEDVEFFPTGHVRAFGRLLAQNSFPI